MLAQAANQQSAVTHAPRAFQKTTNSYSESKVCSVQRMTVPENRDADWAARSYFRWLPKTFKWLIAIRETSEQDQILFILKPTGHTLLGLKRMPHRSTPDRQVLKVTAGLLAIESDRGRLEFRQVLNEGTLIASIQDFIPRLPWWIYRPTQGIFHKWVMHRFRRYLKTQR